MVDTITKSRIEALSDGIFAIAMTLLVLDLLIPGNSENLNVTLYSYLPKLESYFITFAVSGVYWLQHQLQFDVVKRASRTLVWINILFLMFVALIPATTMLLMRYNNYTIAAVIYASNLFMVGVVLFFQWLYLTSNPELLDHSSQRIKKFKLILILVNPLVCLVAIVIAFINPNYSTTVYYAIPIIFYFLRKRMSNYNTNTN